MSLNAKEFQYVKDSWGNVEKRLKLDGSRIFVRMFQKHPEYKAYFPDFENFSDEELKYNNRLKSHVLRVSTALGLLIYSVGNEESLKVAARSLINTHHFRWVRRPQFNDFFTIYLEYISYVVRTKEARDAWRKAVDIIAHAISYDDTQAELF